MRLILVGTRLVLVPLVGIFFFYCLFQSVIGTVILQFDLDTQIPAQIDVLPEMHGDGGDQISPAEDGGLLFLAVRDFSLNLWKHKINSDSAAAGWVLEKTIELDRLLPFEPRPHTDTPAPMNILGFAEEHNVVFLATAIGVFMVNLESMQFKILPQAPGVGICHPFTSFYTKGNYLPCLLHCTYSKIMLFSIAGCLLMPYLLSDIYCSFNCLVP